MPANRRHRRHERRPDLAELNEFQKRHLMHGHPLFPWESFASREDFAAAWQLHGESILADWIEEHPGTRPLAWWMLDHGQERPWGPPYGAPWGTAEGERVHRRQPECVIYAFGFLHSCSQGGVRPDGRLWEFQEREDDYLERHGLMSAKELAVVRAWRAEEITQWQRTREALRRLDARRSDSPMSPTPTEES